MFFRRAEPRTRPGESEIPWDAWFGDCAADARSRRLLGAGRGKANVFAAVADNGAPAAGEAVVKLCADSYLRRPSVSPTAVNAICAFMNNLVLAQVPPRPGFRFDAAVLFLLGGKASWTVSGAGSVLLFEGTRCIFQSEAREYPVFGLSPAYPAAAPEPLALPAHPAERLSLLVCAGPDTAALDAGGAGAALEHAETPGDWLRAVMAPLPDGSAVAAFLPPRPSHRFGGHI